MAKTYSQTVNICNIISKGSIYLLTFLLPIFFLPWTANVLDFNKQALLIFLVSASLFTWILKVLISGRLSLNLSRFNIPVVILFLVYLISTCFSLWKYGSFWGWPLSVSESLLSIIGLFLFYFLVSNIFKKKEIFYLIMLLILSGVLAMVFGGLQLFGKFLLPLDFTKTVSFNTVGTVNVLSLLAAVLLPLITVLVIKTKKLLKIALIVALVVDLALLILINFSTAWWVVIVGIASVMILGAQKRRIFDNRWLILPMFFLAIALFSTFFRLQIPNIIPTRPIEVSLTQRASFDIALKSLRSNLILGSGPGTFIYDFSKYKNITFNQNRFWNVRFDWGSSKVLTVLATVGVLGLLSLLALIGSSIFYGIKFFFRRTNSEDDAPEEDEGFYWMLGTGIFVSFIALSAGFFLYRSNLTLDFLFFLLMGSFVALLSPTKRVFSLKSSSLVALGANFVFTSLFIFGLGLFILEGQRYIAGINYLQGVRNWRQGKTEEALNNLEGAARMNPNVDLYWRELSQVYLQRVSIEAVRTDLSQEEINQKIQLLVNNAVNSAKAATDINPLNVANWSVRGFVYQSLVGIVPGVRNWAVQSYDEALNLEPTNPYYFNQEGIALLQEISLVEEEQRQELLTEAKTKFERAIELKSDYAPARFQIASVYQLQGKTAEAIQELETTKLLAPFDVGLAFQLGLIYYQNENYEKARIELERAIGISPNYSNALYFLGLTYSKEGERAQAIEKFERVSEINPKNEEIERILSNLRAGRKPLDGIVEEVPPVVPIEEEQSPEA